MEPPPPGQRHPDRSCRHDIHRFRTNPKVERLAHRERASYACSPTPGVSYDFDAFLGRCEWLGIWYAFVDEWFRVGVVCTE